MKAHQWKLFGKPIVAVCVVFFSIASASAAEYEALRDDNSVKVFFDMRDGIPEIAAVHTKLINDTYKQLTAMGKSPNSLWSS